jgi:hypothetical protein
MGQHKDVAMELMIRIVVFPLSRSPIAMPNSTLDHLLPSHIFAWYVLVYALGATSM